MAMEHGRKMAISLWDEMTFPFDPPYNNIYFHEDCFSHVDKLTIKGGKLLMHKAGWRMRGAYGG
jgi:hypothetical protein